MLKCHAGLPTGFAGSVNWEERRSQGVCSLQAQERGVRRLEGLLQVKGPPRSPSQPQSLLETGQRRSD